ncbi:MAG: hypothetical protein WB762_08355 [Candidatus Sulfotelmatobacter sp.]
MYFKIVAPIPDVDTIATGAAIRERKRLWKNYGKARSAEAEKNRVGQT